MNNNFVGFQPILVVEDSDEDFVAIKRACKKVGVNVRIERCPNGQDALDYLNNLCLQDKTHKVPSIIMLDLNMPLMDGKTFLKKIKSHTILRQIPIVVVTSSNNEKEIEECYTNGANAYLCKPAEFNEFVENIKSLKQFWLETATLPVITP